MIKSKQLAKAIFELSESGEKHLDEKVLKFMEERKLTAQIPSVLYHLEKIMEAEQEKKGIVIETAHEIHHETANKIRKFLDADHLKEVIKVKKELIGGFRAKWGGQVYDTSILTGLKKLEEAIIK